MEGLEAVQVGQHSGSPAGGGVGGKLGNSLEEGVVVSEIVEPTGQSGHDAEPSVLGELIPGDDVVVVQGPTEHQVGRLGPDSLPVDLVGLKIGR